MNFDAHSVAISAFRNTIPRATYALTLRTNEMPRYAKIFGVAGIEFFEWDGKLMNHVASTSLLLVSEGAAEEHVEDVLKIIGIMF